MTTPWSADWTSSAVVADRASTGDAALAVVVDKPLVDKPLVDEHVVDEHRVRACAGMTMVLGAVAFAYAYFRQVAWTLGLAMSGAMAVITNSGIRGWLPRTICLICGHGACDVQPPEPGGDGR